jgi:N4-gp56 family major capsid protein
MAASGTYLADLIDPQVLADIIDSKLVDAIRFAPLAVIDDTLVGRPGSTVDLPRYAYIGDATTVAEGADIPIVKLEEDTVQAEIHKICKGTQITDEAILSGFGNPVDEGAKQLLLSIASKLDNEMLTVLGTIASPMVYTGTKTLAQGGLEPEDVNNGLELFGEDVDGEKVLLCSPALHTKLRNTKEWVPASEIAADMLIKGAVGEAYGCQVVVSNKLKTSGNAFVVKPGALRIFLKRDTLVETARDIVNKSTIVTADKHEVCYLYDASKAIKLVPAT